MTERSVLPVIGLKEAVAWLPTLLGLRGEKVVIPEVAYPTYEVGALMAGCEVIRCDDPATAPRDAAFVFINSPSNPTGAVLDVEQMRAWVVSILHPSVTDGDNTGLLALHSLSKTSNLASYRAGTISGDEALVQELLLIRKHSGLIVPGPIQAAMVAALGDDLHEQMQRSTYAARRLVLMKALQNAGLTIDDSDAGLYLWVHHDGMDSRELLNWFADHGILGRAQLAHRTRRAHRSGSRPPRKHR